MFKLLYVYIKEAYRMDTINDMKLLAWFKKVIKNYQKIKRLDKQDNKG